MGFDSQSDRDKELEELIREKIDEREKEIRRDVLKKIKSREKDQNNISDSIKNNKISRRDFLKKAGLGAAGVTALGLAPSSALKITKNDILKDGSSVIDGGSGAGIPKYSSDPSNPDDGEIWYNTNSKEVKVHANNIIRVLSTHPDYTTSIGMIDGFEDGDISEYQQDTGRFSISTNKVTEGSNSVIGTSHNGTGTPIRSNDSFIFSKNLDNYPSRGYEFKYDWYFNGSPSGDAAGNAAQAVIFCVQDENNYYYAGSHNNNVNYIYKVKNGSIAKSTTSGVSNYNPDTWYGGTIQIGSSSVSFTDSANNNTVSISDTEWDRGGLGFVAGSDSTDIHETIFDNARASKQL